MLVQLVWWEGFSTLQTTEGFVSHMTMLHSYLCTVVCTHTDLRRDLVNVLHPERHLPVFWECGKTYSMWHPLISALSTRVSQWKPPQVHFHYGCGTQKQANSWQLLNSLWFAIFYSWLVNHFLTKYNFIWFKQNIIYFVLNIFKTVKNIDSISWAFQPASL